MYYITKNKDGSVAVTALVPQKLVHDADNVEIPIQGIRRDGNATYFRGALPDGRGFDIRIGTVDLDVHDLRPDHISGYTVVYPDFEKDILAKWTKEEREKVESFSVVAKSDIPQDRTFREAWVANGSVIEHDMPKAREIHLNRLRKERNKQLDALDNEHARATGQGKKKDADAIEKKRQALRDMPETIAPTLENAQTPEELKAITLDAIA